MFWFAFAKVVLLFFCPRCNHGNRALWLSLCWWRKITLTVLTDSCLNLFPVRPLTSSSSLLGVDDLSFPLMLLAGWLSVRPRSASSDTSRAGIGCLQKRNESYWLFDFSIVWEWTWEEPDTKSSLPEQQSLFSCVEPLLVCDFSLCPLETKHHSHKVRPRTHRIRTFHGSVLQFIKTLCEILLFNLRKFVKSDLWSFKCSDPREKQAVKTCVFPLESGSVKLAVWTGRVIRACGEVTCVQTDSSSVLYQTDYWSQYLCY